MKLQARDVLHQFDKEANPLFREVSLTISQGTSISIVGQSGSGKTTLLNILSGLLKPIKGEIEYNHESVYSLSSKKISRFRKEKIGFMFQDSYLIPQLTVKENCQIITNVNEESESLFKKLALDLGVHGLRDRFPENLSGGEKQRINLLRALMHKPEFVFADEPTGSLDQLNAETMSNLMFDVIEKEDCSFIIVTHNQVLANKAKIKFKIENQKLIQYE